MQWPVAVVHEILVQEILKNRSALQLNQTEYSK